MTIKTTLSVVMASALLFGAGCKKGEDTSAPAPDQGSVTAPGGATVQAGNVTRYPGEVPQGGTVRLLQPFTVYQSADRSSPVLTRVGVDTWVNLKASFSNWMLIEWPSGVGQLSPGWIELRDINDNRVTTSKASTTATTPPPPATTAPPPAVTATPTGVTTAKRPAITIKPRGK